MKILVSLSILLCGLLSETAVAQSEVARAFFENQLVIDGTCFPYYRPGSTMHRFPRQDDGTFDMAEYRKATGVDIAVWDIRHPEEMKKMIRGVEGGPFRNVKIIRTYDDIESVFRAREHGWLFHTQHPWPLNGTIDPIEGWHRDGLRMLQIVYGTSISVPEIDRLGTGSSSGDDEIRGLTELGKKVVTECNRVGIILDVSHCNRQTTLDVAAISTVPITATHAGCAALTPVRRNKTDEEIRAIAKTGGVFGITPIKFMLTDADVGADMDDFIRHLEHAIDIAGVEHVGISSDLKQNGVPESETPAYTSPELNDERRWFHLYDALKAKGYEDEALAKIFGRNFLRVFKAVL